MVGYNIKQLGNVAYDALNSNVSMSGLRDAGSVALLAGAIGMSSGCVQYTIADNGDILDSKGSVIDTRNPTSNVSNENRLENRCKVPNFMINGFCASGLKTGALALGLGLVGVAASGSSSSSDDAPAVTPCRPGSTRNPTTGNCETL